MKQDPSSASSEAATNLLRWRNRLAPGAARGEDGTMVSDVAIIGAGVVGCAIARRFALEGLAVTLIEAGGDILSGASKANSAILHTGFDAPPGSLELACIRAG